jgi:UDP-glucose 4-epimerase
MRTTDKSNGRAFVTGGAGFIGSHVVDRIIHDGGSVTVYDNLSTGFEENLENHAGGGRLTFHLGDVLDLPSLSAAMEGHEILFHFQANADVRGGIANTRTDLEQNTIGTWNVLEAARLAGIKTIVFASSATIYGEPVVFPTPEDTPLIQTSLYGASKLAGEAMIHAFAEYFGIRSIVFRFVSWIGPRYSHGVVFDFIKKLRSNPNQLEILGDGKQVKSYLDVRDGVSGIFCAIENFRGMKGVFNLGHDEFIDVLNLARIVISEMGLKDVRLLASGGTRGWVGDSPLVHLDTSRMKAFGWSPRISIDEGVRATARFLLKNPGLLDRRR